MEKGKDDMSKLYAKIAGVGKYLPEKVLDNAYFESIVDTSDEWITKRVGVKERRMSDENTFTSDLAAKAAENALRDADMTAEDIDLIIVASVSPEMYTPSCACRVQSLIGAKKAAAFDLNAACSGFIFAAATASQFIGSGMYKNVLVIGADTLTKITEYKDRSTCVLFGDGAGAAVFTATEEKTGILGSILGADGDSGNLLTICGLKVSEEDKERRPYGNYSTIWMDGQGVFKFAVKTMESATVEVVEKAGCSMDDVKLVIPHQANYRIIEGARKRLKLDTDRVFFNVEKYGNMSAACVPVALCEAIEEGRVHKGDKLVIVGFGGGLTWGSALIEL